MTLLCSLTSSNLIFSIVPLIIIPILFIIYQWRKILEYISRNSKLRQTSRKKSLNHMAKNNYKLDIGVVIIPVLILMVVLLLGLILFIGIIVFPLIILFICIYGAFLSGCQDNEKRSSSYLKKPQKSTINVSKAIKLDKGLENTYRKKFCVKCGIKLAKDAIFCHNCGNATNSNIRYCQYCGKERIQGALFCHNCGNLIMALENLEQNYVYIRKQNSGEILKFCRSCGAEKESSEEYCSKCGEAYKN